MLVVVALGGNALLRRGEPLDASAQRANVKVAAEALAEVARRHRAVLTHGNGPQVGLLALQAEAYTETAPYPLDVLGAETEGMIGYLLEQELGHHLPPEGIITVLTQVVVDRNDPAFAAPSKFIGPVYDRDRAMELASIRGWSIAQDGDRWRRVVASPEPKDIVEIDLIRLLVDRGVTVICAGGGGIPVAVDDRGGFSGIEAVVDKDLSACLLAQRLGADALVMLTDVPAVMDGWGTAAVSPLAAVRAEELRRRSFPAGSMAPKVDAACRFVEGGGSVAAIGALEDVVEILDGTAGTRVSR